VTAKSWLSHFLRVPRSDCGEDVQPAGQDFVDATDLMIGDASEKLPQSVAGRPRGRHYTFVKPLSASSAAENGAFFFWLRCVRPSWGGVV